MYGGPLDSETVRIDEDSEHIAIDICQRPAGGGWTYWSPCWETEPAEWMAVYRRVGERLEYVSLGESID